MPVGPRIRDNNVIGTISDNPLTAGAASFNSVLLPLLSAVVSAHAIVTLDPLRQYGNPEIVIVTSHTAASTVATITRGAYNTTARSHPQGTVWIHSPMNEDVVPIVTSGTRPSDPYIGETIYETDTDRYIGRTAAGAWQQKGLFFDSPSCRIRRTTAKLIVNATQTAVDFDAERYDTDNMHDNVNNTRITFNTAGLYLVTFTGEFIDGDYTFNGAYIRRDGTTPIATGPSGGTRALIGVGGWIGVTTIFKFTAGQYVEAVVQQQNTGAASRNLASAFDYSPEFSATWIGRGN